MRTLSLIVLLAFLAGCATTNQHVSEMPSHDPEPVDPHAVHHQAIDALKTERAHTQFPTEDNYIWMGRRLAYIGEYQKAIDEFTAGLAQYPRSYKLLRHRGHRWITLRRFDLAVEDLSRAASYIRNVADEVEPDGMPNAYGQPRSTTHTNIFYHLGLAHYLRDEFRLATAAFRRCLDFATNDDMHVAASYWLYLSQRQLGATAEAAYTLNRINSGMHVFENVAYHRLLLLYKGELSPGTLGAVDLSSSAMESAVNNATFGYGLGMWYLLQDQRVNATRIFRDVIAETNPAAFGHIAADVELRRMFM